MWSKLFCKKFNIVALLIGLIVVLSACGKKETLVDSPMPTDCVYYLNHAETKIIPVSLKKTEFDLAGKGEEEAILEAIDALSAVPEDNDLKNTLGVDTTLLKHSLENGVLLLDFDSEYLSLKPTTEVLFRAALVRTFNAIDGVESVVITIEGNDLYDANGRIVGNMIADTFIDNPGDEINAYEKTVLTLYFATTDGTHLAKEQREVEYSSNISKEKLVVEQLISGPKTEGLTMTVAPERKVNSVTTKDGVCYVNLSDVSIDTLSLYGPIAEEVSIYSIVNSLCELSNVNKVQISIDGETDRLYRENFMLDKMYERNLDIVIE